MGMVAAMVGQDANECARVIDLLHLVPREDSGVRGQLVGELAVALRKNPIVSGKVESLVVLE
jgi:hypothetical protein